MTREQQTQSREKRPAYQNAIVVGLVLLLMGVSISCVQFKVSTIMTSIAPHFNLTSEGSTWLMSIFTLMGIFFALPAGGSAQRFGFKKVMLISSGSIVLAAIIGLVANGTSSGAVLMLSRAIEGIALTFISTCAPIAIQKCVDPRRVGTATGIWGCWGNTGAVVAAVLTPQLFASAGFEGVWIFFGAFAAVAAIVLFFVVKEPGIPLSEQIESATFSDVVTQAGTGVPAGVDAMSASAPTTRYRDIFTKDSVLHLVSFAIINLLMLALLGLLPTVLMLPEKGFDMSVAGVATTVPSIIMLASSPLFGALAGRTGKLKELYVVTMCALGPGLFLMYTQTNTLFWVGAVLLGAVGFGCLGLAIAGWMKVVPRPELIPKAMGILTLTQGLGQFLGTFLVQMLLGPDFSNWLVAGIVLMVFGFVGAAAVLMVNYDLA